MHDSSSSPHDAPAVNARGADRRVYPWTVQVGGALVAMVLVFSIQLPTVEYERDAPAVNASLASVAVPASLAKVNPDGQQLYMRMCSSCHGPQGHGTPNMFPPLTETRWVTGDEGRLIRVLLHGIRGPIEVKGVTYSSPMPGWGDNLDDEEMAALVNFIRTSWGNDASTITPEDVARVREATEGRRDAWTAEEFEDEENLGIPDVETE